MAEFEEIVEIFGIFHDGCIAGGRIADRSVEIIVEIQYLAERIRPTDQKFLIRIEDCDQMRFIPWIDDENPSIPDITHFDRIVSLDLEVLSAEADGSIVKVACNQARSNLGYCGGFLEIEAVGYSIIDESGREWNLEELKRLSSGYWNDWAAKNKNAHQSTTSSESKF